MFRGPLDTTVKDLLFILAMSVVVLMILIASMVRETTTTKTQTDDQNSVMFEIAWPPGPWDVDLWVLPPSGEPVGYSNGGSKEVNLLRDDLGELNDPLPVNYEVTFSRGFVPGQYSMNVYLYSPHGGELPLTVTGRVLVRTKKREVVIWTGSVQLRSQDHQVTMVSFVLSSDGTIDRRTITEVQRPFVPQAGN